MQPTENLANPAAGQIAIVGLSAFFGDGNPEARGECWLRAFEAMYDKKTAGTFAPAIIDSEKIGSFLDSDPLGKLIPWWRNGKRVPSKPGSLSRFLRNH
jgi:hypothetical protein